MRSTWHRSVPIPRIMVESPLLQNRPQLPASRKNLIYCTMLRQEKIAARQNLLSNRVDPVRTSSKSRPKFISLFSQLILILNLETAGEA